ncbi:hypothetical protein ACJ41O_006446 [Fusarium nematophilum]
MTNNVASQNLETTARFAEFIANATPDYLSPTLVARIKEYLLDYLGVTIAAANGWESTEEIFKGILALGARGGSSTVALKGQCYLPQFAGLLNATFGHSMDFDDTYAAGSLHAGVCAFAAGLAQAELLDAAETSERFMLAVAVGYEVICRLGRELGNDAYARGFHNTATAGIFGAVAAIAVLKRLSASTIEHAFGLALSKAAGSMQYLENGSWNKRLHPGFAVHDAFVSVALAEAGVRGAAKSIEGKLGLLHAYSPRTEHDLVRLSADLGTRWDFLETALKPYPACRMTHGLIEHGARLGAASKHREVEKMTVSLSPANHIVVGAHEPNKVHPNNVVDAQFSAYFQLAYAWLYGSETGIQFRDKLDDPAIHDMADKIECITDTRVKSMGSKLRAQFADGGLEELDIPYPLGEPEHPLGQDMVVSKYLSLVSPVIGPDKAQSVKEVVDGLEHRSVVELLNLISSA